MSGEEIRRLEERIAEAEDKISRLLRLSNRDHDPFAYLSVETNLTKGQVSQILNLMDEARNSLSSQSPMNHVQFEHRVYEIVPERSGHYHFAEDIVASFNQSGAYTEVYRHMKADGMNI